MKRLLCFVLALCAFSSLGYAEDDINGVWIISDDTAWGDEVASYTIMLILYEGGRGTYSVLRANRFGIWDTTNSVFTWKYVKGKGIVMTDEEGRTVTYKYDGEYIYLPESQFEKKSNKFVRTMFSNIYH